MRAFCSKTVACLGLRIGLAVEAVWREPVSAWKLPANREIYREIWDGSGRSPAGKGPQCLKHRGLEAEFSGEDQGAFDG
jgi:hypothetical protein